MADAALPISELDLMILGKYWACHLHLHQQNLLVFGDSKQI